MTVRELLLWMDDNFGDWIDGDDPVEDFEIIDTNRIWVNFESGQLFVITVAQVYGTKEQWQGFPEEMLPGALEQ